MRALVSLFAALLIIISVYQLSFTWFVNSAMSRRCRQKRKLPCRGNFPSIRRSKISRRQRGPGLYQDTLDQFYNARLARLLDSTKDTKITPWGTTYQKSKESELLLGLDLQGGMSVTMDIALDGLIKGLANNPRDASVLKAIAMARQKKMNQQYQLHRPVRGIL